MQTLRDLFDDVQLSTINDAPLFAGTRHPTWWPLYAEKPRIVDILVHRSVAIISRQSDGERWLADQVSRLLDFVEINNAASSLAEIRAYGGLLRCGFQVSPISPLNSATPDFSIDAGDGPITVEVFAKHQDKQEDERVSAAHSTDRVLPADVRRRTQTTERTTVTTTTVAIAPAGKPDPTKLNDSVQANLISRVCAVKQDERQIPGTHPALLIADFANFGGPIAARFTGPSQAVPLLSGHRGLTSGAIWYSMYAWKGAPVFEEGSPRIVRLGHEGRFRPGQGTKSKFSALLAVFSKGAVLLENPWAAHRLPDRARLMLCRYPWFDLSRSIADWRAGDAELQIGAQRRMIEVMDESLGALHS